MPIGVTIQSHGIFKIRKGNSILSFANSNTLISITKYNPTTDIMEDGSVYEDDDRSKWNYTVTVEIISAMNTDEYIYLLTMIDMLLSGGFSIYPNWLDGISEAKQRVLNNLTLSGNVAPKPLSKKIPESGTLTKFVLKNKKPTKSNPFSHNSYDQFVTITDMVIG